MRLFFTLGIFLVTFACFNSFGQEIPITLHTNTGILEGTLSLPENAKKPPVVLIIAGSGPTDRDGNQANLKNNSLKMTAEELGKSGIASVRFDKRGIGASVSRDSKESDLRFETYIEDVDGWINLLAKDKRFSKIILAGHSEGSLIGMVAASNNKEVDAFISIAGPARPADEMIKEQLMAQPEQVRDMVYPMLDTLKKGDTLTHVPQMLNVLFRPSVQPYLISLMKYDPKSEIRKLKIPVLIVQGTTDIQVLEKDADLLAEAYPKGTKKIIQSMNHVLKDCVTTDRAAQVPIYSNPDLPLNREFINGIISFIKKL